MTDRPGHIHRRLDAWHILAASITGLLMLLVVVTPLPLGSHRDWGWAAIALAASFLLFSVSALVFSPVPPGRQLTARISRLRWPLLCILMLPAWGVVQASGLGPASWVHPAWMISFGEIVAAPPPHAAISIAPDMSLTSAMRLLSYFAIGFSALAVAVYRPTLGLHLLRAVAAAGVIFGTYGLLELAMRVNVAVHPAVMPYPADLLNVDGPFVNRNHFATFVGMALICLIALWRRHMIMMGLRMPATARRAIRDGIERFLGPESIYLIGAAVMSCALLLSGSRAGVGTTLAGVVVFLILVHSGPQSPQKTSAVPWVAGGGLVVGFFMLAGYPLLTRVLDTPAALGFRRSLTEIGLQAIGDRPLLGHGIGAFEQTYFLYSTPEYARLHVDYIHNEFLELAAGAGLLVALALVLGFALLGRTLLAGSARKRGGTLPACGAAVICQVGLHSVFDFSMSVPAVALTFAVVLGVTLASATAKTRSRGRRAGLSSKY